MLLVQVIKIIIAEKIGKQLFCVKNKMNINKWTWKYHPHEKCNYKLNSTMSDTNIKNLKSCQNMIWKQYTKRLMHMPLIQRTNTKRNSILSNID